MDIHGTAVCLTRQTDAVTLACEYGNPFSRNFPVWAEQGHVLKLFDRTTMAPLCEAVVQSYRLLDEDRFLLTLTEPLPAGLSGLIGKKEIGIENLTNTPRVTIRSNRFGSCRSRGILVTTPKPVVIEDNLFESAGAAVLLSGDAGIWYESGACRDVLIRRNIFTDCCALADYQYSFAMISICPLIAKPKISKPFHGSVRIEDNTFFSPDTPILYAFSVNRLTVRGNRFFHSERVTAEGGSRSLFSIKNCRRAEFADNTFIGHFLNPEKAVENSTLLEVTSKNSR